jgi:hypothetical protein
MPLTSNSALPGSGVAIMAVVSQFRVSGSKTFVWIPKWVPVW